MKYSPTRSEAYFFLGKIHAKLGNIESAVKAYKNYAKLSPENAALSYYKQGKIHADRGNLVSAACCFAKLIEKSVPEMKDKLIIAGYHELIENEHIAVMLEKFHMRNYKEAVEIIPAEDTCSKNVVVNYHLGESYRFIGKIDRAIQFFRKVLLYVPFLGFEKKNVIEN